MLDIRHYFSYNSLYISLSEGPAPEAHRRRERGRRPRAELQAAPGQLRASASWHYRPGREVLAGLGQVKAGNARTNCARFCPRNGDDYRIGANPRPRKHDLRLGLWDDESPGSEPWWNADRRAPPAGGAAVPAARPAGESVCRRSASLFVLSSRRPKAQTETKAPPLHRHIAPSPSRFIRGGNCKTRAHTRRENEERFSIVPRFRWGGTKDREHAMKRRLDRVMTHDADRVVDRGAFAVALATLPAAPKSKAKQRPLDAAVRFAIEKALQQRRYCNAFALWRTCRDKRCRRAGTCCGNAGACLKLRLVEIPHDVQWRVRQHIVDATPRNIGAPERKARQSMPGDLYA